MSKNRNYSKMYTKDETEVVAATEAAKIESDIPDTCISVQANVIPSKPEVTPEVPKQEKIFGIVAGCEKLNVRVKPNKNSDVAYVITAGTKVDIDLEGSTKEWYRVHNSAGVEGFCMKTFVDVKK